jgi:putative ATP-binding cassette transporter
MAFTQLLGAFSLIVNQFQSISSFAAVIARLSALVGAVEKGPPSARTAVAVVEAEGRLAYQGVTLFSPDGGREVLKKLTADIPRGTRVMVVGPNEAARTALFRATAGIWPTGLGRLSARR